MNFASSKVVNVCNDTRLCDSNRIQTHNHLVRKRTLKYLAKLAKWSLMFETDEMLAYVEPTCKLK